MFSKKNVCLVLPYLFVLFANFHVAQAQIRPRIINGYAVSIDAPRMVSLSEKNHHLDRSENDLALIKLTEPILGIPTVILPTASDMYAAGTSVEILGWGYTDPTYGVLPDILQEASVPIIDKERCRELIGTDFDPLTMMCAGVLASNESLSDGVDSCNGDSGGPLGVSTINGFVLLGVTSWGYGCGSNRYYGVYTNVLSFADWLTSQPEKSPIPITKPKILGLPVVGKSLRCSVGEWSDMEAVTSYRWIDAITKKAVSGKVGSRYRLTSRDIGRSITCEVTKTNSFGSHSIRSRALGPILPSLNRLMLNRRSVGSFMLLGFGCVEKQCTVLAKTVAGKKIIDALALVPPKNGPAPRSATWEEIPIIFIIDGESVKLALPQGVHRSVIYLRVEDIESKESQVISFLI